MMHGQPSSKPSRPALEAPSELGLAQLIERALAADPGQTRWLCLSLPAPVAPAERLLGLTAYADAVLWAPSADDERAGVGAARVLSASGARRFEDIREQASALFGSLSCLALYDDAAAVEPLLLGGFAFQAGTPSALWTSFGEARFLLPRIGYARRGHAASLLLCAERAELSSSQGRERLALDAIEATRALTHAAPPARPASRISLADEREAEWTELVTGIRREIDAGRLEKVVAARRITLRGDGLPDAATVLERLRLEAPESCRFALSAGGCTFLGASPERLVRRAGRHVSTEAVAGSVRGGDPERAAQLLKSAKDGAEQAIVSREIRAALAPLCAELDEQGPVPYRLRHVVHLRTRFEGTLRADAHVLDLVERLHPTPAVGGTPSASALRWIAEHEPTERGFYAGPFGVLGADGDGEFVVALRSGLLTPEAAHLFAGAGIVGGSEAERELTETRWKLRGLLSAIGVG